MAKKKAQPLSAPRAGQIEVEVAGRKVAGVPQDYVVEKEGWNVYRHDSRTGRRRIAPNRRQTGCNPCLRPTRHAQAGKISQEEIGHAPGAF